MPATQERADRNEQIFDAVIRKGVSTYQAGKAFNRSPERIRQIACRQFQKHYPEKFAELAEIATPIAGMPVVIKDPSLPGMREFVAQVDGNHASE